MRRLSSSIRSLLTLRATWDLLVTLTLGCALSTCAPVSARAETPPAESQIVIVPRAVFEQCEVDARRVDRLEPALRSCQRDLDAQAGALAEVRARREQLDTDRRALERRMAELEARDRDRWTPLTWWGVGVTSALVGVLVVALVVD